MKTVGSLRRSVSAPTVRETRVTARQSIRTPFVPQDMSPVSTLAIEQDKGIPGWTDRDVKLPSTVSAQDKRLAAQRLVEARVGSSVIRKAPRVERRIYSAGPSADYKARQARAARLGGHHK